jgi:hypothetical protein
VGLGDGTGERALDRQDAELNLAAGCGLDDRREARQGDEVRAVREEPVARGGGMRAVAARVSDADSHPQKVAQPTGKVSTLLAHPG